MPSDPHKPDGISVDASGVNTVDPTKNVLDLVAREIQRLNDLRAAETRRVDDLRVAESRRVDEQLSLRAHYEEKLRDAEAKRIDAIRAVDVNAVTVASERQTQSAAVLATQVSQSAETLRALVATNAQSTATQLAQIITPITDRLSLVERAQYEGAGKATVADPQLAQLIIEMRSLNQKSASGEGASGAHTTDTQTSRWLIGLLIGIPALLLTLVEAAKLIAGK